MIKKLLVTSALFLGMIDTSYGSENKNREDRLEESKPLICNQKFSIVVSESEMAEVFLNPLLTASLEYLEFDLINISEAKHLNFLADLFSNNALSKFNKLRTIHIKNVPKNQEFENQLIQVSSQQGNLKIIVQHPLFNEREISPHFNLITIQKCGGSFSFHQNISTQELSKIATLSLPQGNSLLVDNIFYKYSVDPFSIHPANLEKIDVPSTNFLKENQFEAAILGVFS